MLDGVTTLNKRLTAVKALVRQAVRKELGRQAAGIVASQQAAAPVDDNDLRESITYRYGDQERVKYASLKAKMGSKRGPGMSVTVSAGNNRVRYAHLVEFGTASHTIKPLAIRGGFLGIGRKEGSLSINGNVLAPGVSVQHPGAKAHPFFWHVWRNRRKPAMKAINKAARDAIKQALKK